MIYYELESSEERKARRNKGIKTLFQQLVIEEGMPCMEAYEAVGYQFYLSAVQIRAILSGMNKKWWKPAQEFPKIAVILSSKFEHRWLG